MAVGVTVLRMVVLELVMVMAVMLVRAHSSALRFSAATIGQPASSPCPGQAVVALRLGGQHGHAATVQKPTPAT